MEKLFFKGLSGKEREIISILTAKEKVKISTDDVIDIISCTRSSANQILSRLTKKGWLYRIKRGMYFTVPITSLSSNPIIEDLWPLAVKVFEPAYISGWTAAEHWNFTEQIFNSLSIVTQKRQRKSEQFISRVKIKVKVLKEEYFFGTKNLWFGSNKIQIADPSKLIIDILDMPEFGGGGRHVVDIVKSYWNSDIYNSELLLDYALRFGKGSVIKRIGFLAEYFKANVSKKWLENCQNNISAGISNLDPNSPPKGKILSKWNLRINIPI